MLPLGLVVLGGALIGAFSAKATDFTLSESAILSLDYNLSSYWAPPPTATLMSEQDIPGTGVLFNFHFLGTSYLDCFRYQVSDSTYGAGTLAGLNVGAYSNFDLKFTLLSIDGSTSGSGWVEVGSVIGPYNGNPWGVSPVFTSRTGYPVTTVSTISVTLATISDIGFAAILYPPQMWSAGPHDISLLVQPADGAVQIPEPTTWAMVTLGIAALFGSRRLRCRSS
jgi:hypothetical protein